MCRKSGVSEAFLPIRESFRERNASSGEILRVLPVLLKLLYRQKWLR
jgi:hypothetical protein